MKKLFGALLFALALVGTGFSQATTPNISLNLYPGDQAFSNNMYALDNMLAGGTASLRTTTLNVATTTFTSLGMSFPPVPAGSAIHHGHCNIIWEQLTAVSTVQFGIGQSVIPTNLWALSVISFGSAGGTTQVAYGTQNVTAATAISGAAVAPGAITTGYRESLDVTVVNGVAGPDVITVYGNTGNVADALQIQPGSYCNWSL